MTVLPASPFAFADCATLGEKPASAKSPLPTEAGTHSSFVPCLQDETAAVTDYFHRQRMAAADKSTETL